jgi:hypothetical protein
MPRYAGFQVVDVSVQDLPGPMDRLRAIPLFTELKDSDLRPHPPHGVAMHHAAQRVKSVENIAIWQSPRNPGWTGQWKSASMSDGLILQALGQFAVGIAARVLSDKPCHGFSGLTKLIPQSGDIGVGICNVLVDRVTHQ